ncbi:MAG: 2OG-Fe(II) oxygenase family protein [Planctomycetota bacterium]|jgi:hypothetical protein
MPDATATAETRLSTAEILDIDRLRETVLATDPFEHVVVPNFVRSDALARIQADYPTIDKPGSMPLTQLQYGPAFRDFVAALDGPEFEGAIGEKFSVDLTDRPTMFTVRARCRAKDGKIHTDSVTKIITVLIYLNEPWQNQGGRLRLLRSQDLEDYVAEVPPDGGTLLVFRRSDHSWHGHESYAGPRRALQMNWVADQSVVTREQTRHRFSAWLKRLRS